jgi:hypothetical protein
MSGTMLPTEYDNTDLSRFYLAYDHMIGISEHDETYLLPFCTSSSSRDPTL